MVILLYKEHLEIRNYTNNSIQNPSPESSSKRPMDEESEANWLVVINIAKISMSNLKALILPIS